MATTSYSGCGADAAQHAEQAADTGQHGRLRQELCQNAAALCADGLFQADLRRALRDGHEHDVHNADTANEQGDAGDPDELVVRRTAHFLQLLGLLEQIVAAVGIAVVARGLAGDDLMARQIVRDSLARVGHGVGRRGADGHVLRLVEAVEHRPDGRRHKGQAAGLLHIHRIVLHGVDPRLEAGFLAHHADDRERLAGDLHDLTDGIVRAKERLGRRLIEDDVLTGRGKVAGRKAAAAADLIAVDGEIVIVHAVELAAEARVAVIEALNILAAAVERHICHAVEGNHLIALLVLQDADAVRRLIGHVDGPVILIELDIDDIAAGTDEILLTEDDREYITCFYSYSIVGIVSRWIGEGMPPYDKDLIKRFSESFDATIDTMINLCEANN